MSTKIATRTPNAITPITATFANNTDDLIYAIKTTATIQTTETTETRATTP